MSMKNLSKHMFTEILLTYMHYKRINPDSLLVIKFDGFFMTFEKDAESIKGYIPDNIAVNDISVTVEKRGIEFDAKYLKDLPSNTHIIEIIE